MDVSMANFQHPLPLALPFFCSDKDQKVHGGKGWFMYSKAQTAFMFLLLWTDCAMGQGL